MGQFLAPSSRYSLLSLGFLLFFFTGSLVSTQENKNSSSSPDKKNGPIQIRWDVPEKQYLMYRQGEDGEGGQFFDVFGYELTGDTLPAPDPGLVGSHSKVPEYLALFLPHQKLRVGEEFEYERKLSMFDDHRFYPFNKHIPSRVTAEGTVTGTEKLGTHRTYKIEQTIDVKMEKSYLAKIKQIYVRRIGHHSYCKSGNLTITGWYDPEAGLLRKFSYSGTFTFANFQSGKTSQVEEEQAYRLDANHEVAGEYRDKGFELRVQEAVQEGIKYIKEQQNDDGTWGDNSHGWQMGGTALATLTLLKSGVSKSDPSVKKSMDWLLDQPAKKTYNSGVAIMALEAYKEDPLLRRKKQDYIKQNISKQEFEQFRQKHKQKGKKFSKREKDWLREQVQFLIRSMNSTGGWSYNAGKTGFDNSNTQYGALGLHSAAKLGATVPPNVWNRMLSHWLNTQQREGHSVSLRLNLYGKGNTGVAFDSRARGWSYKEAKPESAKGKWIYAFSHSVRFPMVVGGIGSVQIALTNLAKQNRLSPDKSRRGKQAIMDGWAWLQAHWTLRNDPFRKWDNRRHYYGLYGLERAGMFTRTRSIGGHNWYQEGAELILSRQDDDGAWNGNTTTTCFSLLFLKRATGIVITGGY